MANRRLYRLCSLFYILLTLSNFSFSQTSYDIDALRFSQYDVSGTARGMGVGGAFSSVGADFGAITLNPAGLGLFRRSEVIFSPAFLLSNSETEYITDPTTVGAINTSKAKRLYVNNLGVVFAKVDSDKKGKLKGYNFAIGYNRMNHFNNKFKFENQNGFSSLMNAYTSSLAGLAPSDINFNNVFHEAVLAYQTDLIRPVDTTNLYSTPILLPVQQSGLWKESGATDMAFISLAVNVDDKIFFGANVNFPFVRYEREYIYSEIDDGDRSAEFESFDFNQKYSTEGNGFNASIGFIAKPNQFVRFGAAIQTPNYFTFSETTNSTMTANFDSIRLEQDFEQAFDYELRLPWRFNAGVTGLWKKVGLVSFDYELVGHKSTKYDFGEINETFNNSINSAIDTNYRNTSTFKVGLEYVLKAFRLRGGYAHTASPFSFGNVIDDRLKYTRKYFTAGIGYRQKVYSIDAAFVHSIQNEFYVPYFLDAGVFPLSVNKITKNNIVVTATYRFRD